MVLIEFSLGSFRVIENQVKVGSGQSATGEGVADSADNSQGLPAFGPLGAEPEGNEQLSACGWGPWELEDSEAVGCDEVNPRPVSFFSWFRCA